MKAKPKNLNNPLLCLGQIIGAHGVRGGVHVRSFAATPPDLGAYGTLRDEGGEPRFTLVRLSAANKKNDPLFIAHFEGVETRDAAEDLRGTRLYIRREQLPPAEIENDFYCADLIGLEARLANGAVLGVVSDVHNFGAGDIVEVAGEMIPFTHAHVPEVDIAGGYIIVALTPDPKE